MTLSEYLAHEYNALTPVTAMLFFKKHCVSIHWVNFQLPHRVHSIQKMEKQSRDVCLVAKQKSKH